MSSPGAALELQSNRAVLVAEQLLTLMWDYPDSVDRRQGSTGVSVRVLMDTCS